VVLPSVLQIRLQLLEAVTPDDVRTTVVATPSRNQGTRESYKLDDDPEALTGKRSTLSGNPATRGPSR
jgi:hypothetical protein